VVEDTSRPQYPATEIPITDTLSVRPTRGGVAYPFRLKVEGDDRDVNASTLTLQSVNVESPWAGGPEDGSAGFFPGGVEQELEKEEEKDIEAVKQNEERPGVERFFTAGPGELMSTKESTTEMEDKAERPGIERFETAMEDLSTIGKGAKA
jgi:hypothetical protein